MASEAFSTAVTAAVGSVAWPVASCWAAAVALVWVLCSESIALDSAPEKLPEPGVGGAGRIAHRADAAEAPFAGIEGTQGG